MIKGTEEGILITGKDIEKIYAIIAGYQVLNVASPKVFDEKLFREVYADYGYAECSHRDLKNLK